MAVAVFDADVVIAFLNARDAQHDEGVARVRDALTRGTERWICAVTLAEILIGPMGIGRADVVERMSLRLGIETIAVDSALARRAAAVRATTRLRLPDAFVLATVIHAEERGRDHVRLESFDERLLRAHAGRHSAG